jgi:hypothetical protein
MFWCSFNLKVMWLRETSSWIASGTDCVVYAAETLLRIIRLTLYLWDDNIKMHLKEIHSDDVNSIKMAWNGI